MKKINGFFIIIRGPLGCGKTTISKALSKILKAKYISFDAVLEKEGLDRKDNNFSPEDFIKANEAVLPAAKKALSKGKIVIFDGCFYFLEQIQHLKKNLPAECYIFTLKASLKTCIERDSKRKIAYGEIAAREVYEMFSELGCGININTDSKTEKEVVRKILSHLQEPA